jgi:hypothetical protein
MARLFVCDAAGLVTADIEVVGVHLEDAFEHELAESVIRCAMLMALSTLVEGGDWPSEALDSMARLMGRMREDIVSRKFN